jgi:CDP-diacylglycerol---glycerol-3-phosphate 3-phosphatidyltransferase
VLNAHARTLTDRVVVPIARGMARLGVTPNWLTFAGLALTLAGMGIVLAGRTVVGALVLAVGLLTDAFDGTVARVRGTASPFGAFYDSVADRIGDAVIFAGLAWMVLPQPWLFALAMVAFGSAMLTSYIRAKAESLGWTATVGFFERAERLIIVVLALLFDLVPIALGILAVGGSITVAQRFWVVWRQAGSPGAALRRGQR